MDHPRLSPDPPTDSADISIGWLAEYEWLVTREARRYAPMLPAGRDDLMQECRIALLNAAEKFDPSLGFPFVAYAGRVLGNAARRFLTRELRHGLRGRATDSATAPRMVSVAPDSGGTKPLLDLIPDESPRPLEWCPGRWEEVFGYLTDTQARVVRLRLFDDLSYREVGERLGFRESHATTVYRQAIERLRERPDAVGEACAGWPRCGVCGRGRR